MARSTAVMKGSLKIIKREWKTSNNLMKNVEFAKILKLGK